MTSKKQTGTYSLSPESYPVVRITPTGTWINDVQITPSEINIELSDGSLVSLSTLLIKAYNGREE